MTLGGRLRQRWVLAAAGAAVVLLLGALALWRLPAPLEVVRSYVRHSYAGNYRAVFPLLSAADRAGLDAEEYALQQGAYQGATLELTRELARSIRFSEVEVEGSGRRAVVRLTVTVPDGNHPAVREAVFDQGEDVVSRLARLRAMAREGFPRQLTSRETFLLVREGPWWRIREGLAEGVAVRFEARVADGLPVTFEPLTDVVRVDPGGLVRGAFRLRNVGPSALTVKARERIEPRPEVLQTVQCFCFLKIELAPGEEKVLPVAFYLTQEGPVEEIRLSYTLHPEAAFPEARHGHGGDAAAGGP